jgi:hypothetical protein
MSIAKQEPEAVERRGFRVSTAIIRNLIRAQAGTLGKAVLEYVMNAIDAGSDEVRIELSQNSITIKDRGRGFTSRTEIEEWFENFGFEHEEGDHRTYGKFGIGRAQLWNFASTFWRTHTFSMDVDIRAKGLDYDLAEGLTPIEGTEVVGRFYEPLGLREQVEFEREFSSLVKYSHVPVYLNGQVVSKKPQSEKWTHETEEAWVLLNGARVLDVYNQGILVRSYSSYMVGAGGVVVTKPGVNFELNMARNDVLQHSCKVWKKLKPILQSMVDRAQAKKADQSEATLANVAVRLISGEIPYENAREFRLFKDITGRGSTLEQFARAAWRRGGVICVGEKGDPVMETLHRQNMAFVITPDTQSRFGAESASALEILLKRIPMRWSLLEGLSFRDDVQDLKSLVTNKMVRVPDEKLAPVEKAILQAVRRQDGLIQRAVAAAGFGEAEGEKSTRRKIVAGEAPSALAWTDGHSYIALEKKTLALAKQGMPGIMNIANILVHEYLHRSSSSDSHAHDQQFYESFENVVTDPRSAELVGRFVQKVTGGFIVEARRLKLPITRALMDSIAFSEYELEQPAPSAGSSVDVVEQGT